MKKLRSIHPTTNWEEGLPLGNGSFGAMVCGGIAVERILFNHEKLFLPFDNDYEMEYDPAFADMIKSEVMAGNYKKAENILEAKHPVDEISPYQPLCELIIYTDLPGEKIRYQRELNLETAEAVISWTIEDIQYIRKQFVSRSDDQFVINITNDKNKKMTSSFALNAHMLEDKSAYEFIQKHFTIKQIAQEHEIYFEGEYIEGGHFGAIMKFVTDGKVTIKKDKFGYDIVQCSEYTHFTAYITGYAYNQPKEPVILPYDELFNRHLTIYTELFNRVTLDFGYYSDKSTEEMLLEAAYETPDPAIYELMFHYSRYLFISCAVDCELPPNLQGIWNGKYEPDWNSDFHNDENIQICMWQALPLRMPEGVKPYMQYYSSCIPDYRQNAKKYFNAKGIAAPVSQTVSGKGLNHGYWSMLPGMAGWIGQLYFNFWSYTQNKEILEKQIVPYLEEAAEFYMSYCTIVDGKCQFIPSFSPENEPKIRMREKDKTSDNASSILCVNSTFDVAVAKEVFSNLIRAYNILGKDASHYQKWLGMMPDYKINSDGALKEWLNDELEDNYEHRHLSHIYPFFPGDEINEYNNKKLFEAVKTATLKRLIVGLPSQSGWSLSHMAAVFARLGLGEEAFTCLKILIRTATMNNLFTRHADPRPQGNNLFWPHRNPIQADAVLGFAYVISEMFLYSSDGYIKIAPSVPDIFKNAKISGLAAKGNIIVDIAFENGIPKVQLTTTEEKEIKLDLCGIVKNITLHKGKNKID